MNSAERAELCGCTLDGRYRVLRRVGAGATGVVFEGRHVAKGWRVAVKTLRPHFVDHPDLGRRLQREAEVGRRVRHPGVLQALDQGRLADGSPYVVMPLLSGESLGLLLRRVQRLSSAQLSVIASRVALILHSAHCAGYVHRDVKPEHILLSRDPAGELMVYLLDFGVCAAVTAPEEERRRERGKVFGTPMYVSPEQAAGQPDVDARADLFALGVVMFEALAGQLPFAAPTVSQLLLRVLQEAAPVLNDVAPAVDPCLSALVTRLLQRDPCCRPPSGRALSRALASYVGDQSAVERQLASRLRLGAFGVDTASSSPRWPVTPSVAAGRDPRSTRSGGRKFVRRGARPASQLL